MFARLAKKVFGTRNERILASIEGLVDQINALEDTVSGLSDEALKNKTQEFKDRLSKGETIEDILCEAFAVVREATKRVLGQRHYDVQLIGGIVLHQGKISEMKTGEGKTQVAALAAYLNALEGKGVHVVTVNEYLVKRDAQWMGQIYGFLGLSTGCIYPGLEEDDRKKAYECDITYGTNNEFGFDYLRDNMKFALEDMVQRPFHFAIVDEVDSILIDEARTPLIISGMAQGQLELYQSVDKAIPRLSPSDYDIDEKNRTVGLTDQGVENAEQTLKDMNILTDGNLYDAHNISLVHHLNQALRAHTLFKKDKDYIVKDNKVVIIDEFTGRMMEGRRYADGLHQAIEAKENVEIQHENQTLASITFQNYFRLYPKLAGMTGTAMTEATEFADIYRLDVVEIPTHVPVARRDENDQIFRTAAEKYTAILQIISECYDRQQPVLVGTTSIEKSETLSTLLKQHKLPHAVLNARYHAEEAKIVAQAGRPGAITIATNMAGRGTDIQLGGNLAMMQAEQADIDIDVLKAQIAKDREIVTQAGGLFVIGTERHESRRIDNQLRGRSGRQGDPGASLFYLSLEDDLMRIFGSDKMDAFLQRMGLEQGQSITHPWINTAIERAQRKVESQHYEMRKNLLKFDNVMNDQRKVIYEQRREIMATEDLSEMITDMRAEVVENLVASCIPERSYPEQWDIATLQSEIQRLFGLQIPIDEWANEEGIADQEILERLLKAADEKAAEKEKEFGADTMRKAEKWIILSLLDQAWKEHLLNLDHLRQGISLRAYAQKDPLNEYKSEAFKLFAGMLDNFREMVTQTMALVAVRQNDAELLRQQQEAQLAQMQEGRSDPAFAAAQNQSGAAFTGETVKNREAATQIDPNDPNTWGRVSRNDPCPCGSGKKYKHCHGAV